MEDDTADQKNRGGQKHEAASFIDPAHDDKVEAVWEEMETGLRHQGRVTPNYVALMVLGGAVAAVGLALRRWSVVGGGPRAVLGGRRVRRAGPGRRARLLGAAGGRVGVELRPADEPGSEAEWHDALREPVRVAEGGEPTRPAGSIDTRSVPATEGTRARGCDAHRKVSGRKRHTVVGTTGLLVAVAVTAAPVVRGGGAESPRPKLLRPGSKYHGHGPHARAAENAEYRIAAVSRPEGEEGRVDPPRRWAAGRTMLVARAAPASGRGPGEGRPLGRGDDPPGHAPARAPAAPPRQRRGPGPIPESLMTTLTG